MAACRWRCCRVQVLFTGNFLQPPYNANGTNLLPTSTPVVLRWYLAQNLNALYLTSIGTIESGGAVLSTTAPPYPVDRFQVALNSRATAFVVVSLNGGGAFSTFSALSAQFDYYATPAITSMSPVSGMPSHGCWDRCRGLGRL